MVALFDTSWRPIQIDGQRIADLDQHLQHVALRDTVSQVWKDEFTH